MKVLRTILIIILALIVLFLIVALFLPSSFSVERSIEINKPVDFVYNTVLDFEKRTQWDPWVEKDADATTSFELGDSTGVGNTWAWQGEIVGSGNLTVDKVIPNEKIHSKLVFISPQQMESDVIWKFAPVENGTKVTWGLAGEVDYPVGRFFGMMMDGYIGPDYEQGLQSLKQLCENAE